LLRPLRRYFLTAIILLATFAGGASVHAYGRTFGYQLFTDGDRAVLRPPDTTFDLELARFGIVKPGQESGGGWREHSPEDIAAAEAADLQAALLTQTNLTREVRDRLTTEHLAARKKFLEATEPWRWRRRYDIEINEPAAELQVAVELPGEFIDYLTGAVEWHHANTNAAIAAWEKLLARPAGERRYKSVWAEFMLGRARLNDEPERAIAHFQRARALAKEGFSDRLQLAHASYGQEARALLNLGRVHRATQLYVEQARTGGWADTLSIKWSVSRAIVEGRELSAFARDPELRRVLTAAITSENRRAFTADDAPTNQPSAAARWVQALEAAKVSDPLLAEQIVLATFIHGDYALTQQWLKRSPQTPVTQWIRAKLFLAEGKVSAATALMETLAAAFVKPPRAAEDELPPPPATMLDTLACWPASGRNEQFHAELGTLRLAQGRFIAGLESYLEADYWGQAAYLGERVLTIDELKAFVDARWETLGPTWTQSDDGKIDHHPPHALAQLLGRRLTREGRGHEAGPYFTTELQANHAALVTHLRTAWDESATSDARVNAFLAAGRIVRTNGLELIGTELDPDFLIYDGQHVGEMIRERLEGKAPEIVDAGGDGDEPQIIQPVAPRWIVPTAAERKRAATVPADPMERWHYRYIASDLLWRAAALLPDQTDAKARVLLEAGNWLKYTYPKAADRYYKALVRTCDQTEIGRAAKAQRWFPRVDAQGKVIPVSARPPVSAAAETTAEN
jgi:hypothetical protein